MGLKGQVADAGATEMTDREVTLQVTEVRSILNVSIHFDDFYLGVIEGLTISINRRDRFQGENE
jgi:hypothetical protein